jgi:hypothetical protein
VIGALLSGAVLLSLQVVAAAAVLAGLAVWRVGRAARLPVIGGMLVGALIPLLVAVTPLILSGSLRAAVDAVLGYSAAYGAIEAPAGERLFAPLVAWSLLALLFLIVPAVLGAARMLRTSGLRRVVAVACVAWIGLSIGLFVYQGRFYGHYAIPLVVPMAVLAGPGIERALRGIAGGPLGRGIRLAPLLVGGLASVLAGIAAGRMEADAVYTVNARARAVAEVLAETTDPGDRLWVWGNAPQLYLAAERPQATPYAYLFPLVTPGYATPAKVEAALADLAADPPRVIVDAGSPAPGSPGFQQLLIPRPLASDGRDLDILDPLRAFVRENYEQGPIIDGWVIYRLLTDPAAS